MPEQELAVPPGAPYLPALQLMQFAAVGPAAVAASEYRPLAQAPEQELDVPPAAPYLPALQLMQSAAVGPAAVVASEYRPLAQAPDGAYTRTVQRSYSVSV